jgi:hypothetical protein
MSLSIYTGRLTICTCMHTGVFNFSRNASYRNSICLLVYLPSVPCILPWIHLSAAADVITAGLVQILVTLSNELLPNFSGLFLSQCICTPLGNHNNRNNFICPKSWQLKLQCCMLEWLLRSNAMIVALWQSGSTFLVIRILQSSFGRSECDCVANELHCIEVLNLCSSWHLQV